MVLCAAPVDGTCIHKPDNEKERRHDGPNLAFHSVAFVPHEHHVVCRHYT